MMPDGNDLLMGAGWPAAKFASHGTTVAGKVVGQPRSQQQTDFATKKPVHWEDGRPKMQVAVNLQTNLRDPNVPNDNGMRTIYIKGKNLTHAVRTAVRASGASKLEPGGELSVTYTGDGEPSGNGKPPKEYIAHYAPPGAARSHPDALAGMSFAPALNGNGRTPEGDPNVIPPCPQGMDEQKWRDLDPDGRARILAALGAR